jgi:hypothetical protein
MATATVEALSNPPSWRFLAELLNTFRVVGSSLVERTVRKKRTDQTREIVNGLQQRKPLKPFSELTDQEKEERCPRCNHSIHTDFDPTVCSFCAHSDKEEGYFLVAGLFVMICNMCVRQAHKELETIERNGIRRRHRT